MLLISIQGKSWAMDPVGADFTLPHPLTAMFPAMIAAHDGTAFTFPAANMINHNHQWRDP
jgi:hypothetical protein